MKKLISITTLSIIFMVLSICIMGFSASAANVCYNVNGNLTQTTKFNVTVGNKLFSSEKIVLTQTGGNTKQYWGGKEKNFVMYGRFLISVYDNTSQKYVYKNQKWKSKTFTIKSSKLKKNHSYTVTVQGDTERYVLDGYNHFPYEFNSWLSHPFWAATKTGRNITFCGY